jgi:excisionase family DNA binding protein
VRRCGLSRRLAATLYRLLRTKKLQGVKVGGQWRIAEEAVRRFLEDGIDVSSLPKTRK